MCKPGGLHWVFATQVRSQMWCASVVPTRLQQTGHRDENQTETLGQLVPVCCTAAGRRDCHTPVEDRVSIRTQASTQTQTHVVVVAAGGQASRQRPLRKQRRGGTQRTQEQHTCLAQANPWLQSLGLPSKKNSIKIGKREKREKHTFLSWKR